MKQSKEDIQKDIPLLATLYLKLYYAVPIVYFPGTKLDIGFMACWAAFFTVARAVVVTTLYNYGWPQGTTETLDSAASFVGGIFHAPNIVPMAYILVKHQNPFRPSAAVKDHPQWWQDAVDAMLQLCTGYMVYDFFFLVLTRYVPGEGIVLDASVILFMLHHFMTSFYMTTTRLYGAGQTSALLCIFMGEFTNPPFNAYLIFIEAKNNGFAFAPLLQQVVVANEILTAVTYIPIRAVISPLVCSYMAYDLLANKTARSCIPIVVRLLWILMMAAVVFGSIGHNYLFYDLLMKHMGVRSADEVAQEL